MIKFKAGKYLVEYESGDTREIYFNKTQRKALNQDLMHDLGIKRIELKEAEERIIPNESL
jgi:hypothetical protein